MTDNTKENAASGDWLTIARKHGYAFPDARMQDFVAELLATAQALQAATTAIASFERYECTQCTWAGPSERVIGDGNGPICPECDAPVRSQAPSREAAPTASTNEAALGPQVWSKEAEMMESWVNAFASREAAPMDERALIQARDALNGLLWQFTSTPSTLKDSNARAQGHAAIKAIDAALAQHSAEPAPIEMMRADFEDWYTSRYDEPLQSRECARQWSAWLAGASGVYKARDDWKVSPQPWGPPDAFPSAEPAPSAPAARAVAVNLPNVCDGKEQDEFEKWAAGEKYDMAQHPMHWLFLNERTYAARQGWKAALEYVSRAAQPAAATVGGDEPKLPEKKALGMHFGGGDTVYGHTDETLRQYASDYAAWANAAGVPEGCKLVPVTDTNQMMTAAYEACWQAGDTVSSTTISAIYRAMVAAAPSQPVEPGKDGKCFHVNSVTQHTGDGTPVEMCRDCGSNRVQGGAS